MNCIDIKWEYDMKTINYIEELDRSSGEVYKLELDKCEDTEIRHQNWKNLLSKYNVYDLRAIYQLYYVLSKKSCENSKVLEGKKVAVIANIYYLDQVENCCKKLNMLSEQIDIYICISEPRLEAELDKWMFRKYKTILKKNRGRDISALLVACRRIILEYEYVCFVHDKKSMQFDEKKWAESWFYSMWENTVGSDCFVKNVIQTMERENELGVLCVPEPVHGCYYSFLGGMWGGNLENTRQFCKGIGVDAKIDGDKEPITLGTTFWCKTRALLPLFEYEFEYEDFPEEPMPKDGTISHAIERSLAYIAQAQGYYTGTLMTDEYSALRLSSLYEMFTVSTLALRTYTPLKLPSDAQKANGRNRMLGAFCKKYKHIYIYGAGIKGKKCAAVLRQLRVDFDGFIVSDGYVEIDFILGKRVYELSKIENSNDVGIIVALNDKNCSEAQEHLEKINVGEVVYY